jgi:penicillin-binding protein 1C
MFTGAAPVITSLTNGMTYLVADKEQQKLQLACAAGSGVHTVYWYINDKFFASGPPGKKMFFQVTGSRIKISCADDKGRSTHISVIVKFI